MDSSSGAPSSENTVASPAAVLGSTGMAGFPSDMVAFAGQATATPGNFFAVDQNTASLMMNPHTAAAMAAAAAAVQQVSQQQQGAAPGGVALNAANPVQPSSSAPQVTTTPAPSVFLAAAPHPHHMASFGTAPVPSAPPLPAIAPNHPAAQQNPFAVMAALFGGAGTAPGHSGSHPSMSGAPSTMPHPTQAPTMAPSMVAQGTQLGGIPNNPAAVAAAAAQVVAAHTANAATAGALTNSLLANVKTWKLKQLESHVQLLRERNEPVPQPITLLLAEARRKEEKRTAKRVANRKSACTSRARKKALVEEMTRANAKLRRQALILALLPDLVIAITVDGKITFCSEQVERVLRHKNQDLVGANISDIMVPASREALQHLIEELVAAERAAALGDGPSAELEASRPIAKGPIQENAAIGNGSGQSSSGSGGEISSGGAAIVSDQSFPPAVVNVQNRRQQKASGGISSDTSTSNGCKPAPPMSSVNNSIDQSTTSASLENEAGVQVDEAAAKESSESCQVKTGGSSSSAVKRQPPSSSDESLSSSSEMKNLRNANEALSRNVRWHNEKMLGCSNGVSKKAHKDDVTGAFVTANNADARLSSLQHYPREESTSKKMKMARCENFDEQSSSSSSVSLLAGVEEKKKNSKDGLENASEDSGYRESNDSQLSPEDDTMTDSSSDNKERPKPLAPTCNVCLIRDDLTSVWCEVTSSIRSKSNKEDGDGTIDTQGLPTPSSSNSKKSSKTTQLSPSDATPSTKVTKELLLCLRPIRDGEKKVDESLQFVPALKKIPVGLSMSESDSGLVTGESNGRLSGDNSASNDADSGGSSENSGIVLAEDAKKSKPPKKRRMIEQQCRSNASPEGNPKPTKKGRMSNDTEKSVVESLILMSNNPPSP